MMEIRCFLSLKKGSKKETEAVKHKAGLEELYLMISDHSESLDIRDFSPLSRQRMFTVGPSPKSPPMLYKRKSLWARMQLLDSYKMRSYRTFLLSL
jgi:hypothetical protein